MEITHPPLPLLPKTKFHINFFFFWCIVLDVWLLISFYFFSSLLVELIEFTNNLMLVTIFFITIMIQVVLL